MNQEEANQKILEIMNKEDDLSQKEFQLFKELIFQCDLKIQNDNGLTPLMYALYYNKEKILKLNQKQLNYLIQNSDLKQQDNMEKTALMVALFYNKKENLQLTKKNFQEMYYALDEEQKQITFKIIIETNYNNNEYLEEINLLLYDLKFKSNEKTRNWLKEKNYQDIIQMIEKRDLFFQLNQEVKEMDNHQKIAIIKI